MNTPTYFRDLLSVEEIDEQDVSAVTALWQSCGFARSAREAVFEIATVRKCPTATILVARANGAVVGTAVAGFDGLHGWMYDIAVDPCLRRNGIGRALVQHGEQWLRGIGATSIRLEIRNGNRIAMQFCRELGYADQGLTTYARQLA